MGEVSDISEAVSLLKSIDKELSWWKSGTTAEKILQELKKINDNLSNVEDRLRDIERSLD